MATPFKGLRTAGYKVSDLAKAKDWYTRILGIEPYFDQPFYVGFNVAGYELGLMPVESAPVAGVGGLVVYWGVDDVSGMYHMLLQAGATPLEAPDDVGEDIVVASVKDPWGNAFGIIYNPHFSLPG